MTDLYPGAKLMQITQWGFPRGALRTNPPGAFSVIHITGNSNLPSAEAEATYRINNPSVQVGASFFVNRNGSIVQTYGDPIRMAPWTNGVLASPDLSNPRIAACVTGKINPNTRSLITIENVGYEPGSSITTAQEVANAQLISYYHKRAVLPITRQTVVGHYQLDSVNRRNCPAVNKALIDRIVALATTTLPDSGTGDDELNPIPASAFAHIVNRKSSLAVAAPFYADASSAAPVHRTYPIGTAFSPVNTAKAEGATWYGGFLFDDSPSGFVFGYFRQGTLKPLEPSEVASGDCSAVEAQLATCRADLAAATAAAESAETRIVQLKAEEVRHGQVVANT